jgi:hypothetical protein
VPGNRSFERGRVRFQVAVSVEQPTARRDEPSERGQRRRGPAPDLSGADAHHPIRRLGPGPGSGIEQADAVVEASRSDQGRARALPVDIRFGDADADVNRRRFLQLAGGSVAATMLSDSIARALAIPANRDPARLRMSSTSWC